MKTIFLFIAFHLCLFAAAQRIKVQAEVTRQEILIGEQFQLRLTATAPAAQNIRWFDFKMIPHFEILSRSKIDTQLNGKIKTLQQTLTMTSWDSGRWQLPAFSLPGSNRTRPIPITISFSPFDPKQDYHDVKDILPAPQQNRITWYWYVIGLVLLGILLWLLFPGKKKKKEVVLSESAYKKALHELDILNKKAQTETDPKFFYTSLIHIFREYLYHRKGIQSFSKTTDDLGRQIGSLSLPADQYQQVLETLQMSDFVKFAKYRPAPSENQESFQTIKKAIVTIEQIKEPEKAERAI